MDNNERIEPAFGASTVTPSTATNTLAEQRHPFTFTGKGSEYFGIWIVNVLLSIVTLGIYSAWAKVRRLQYFHRHTQVAGSSFDFHGKPWDILKGRLIAFGAYAVFIGLSKISAGLSIVLALLLFAVIPYFAYKSLRFRLHNTSWRQVRFKFMGEVPGAYGAFFGWPLAAMFTMYLLAPISHHQISAYTLGNSALGTTLASFKARIGSFYKVYLKTLGFFLIYLAVVGGLAWAVIATSSFDLKSMVTNMAEHSTDVSKGSTDTATEPSEDEEEAAEKESAPENASTNEKAAKDVARLVLLSQLMPLAILALYFLAFLLIGPYFSARINNVIWNGTTLGPMRFESTLSARRLSFITITNFFAIIFTLGFFKPFAAVRVARYRTECLKLVAAGPIAVHVQAIAGNVNARGEEIAEMFDVDIGL
jgi:uncharacterized membrane protein YjgN (DUF898 family)